MGLGSVVFVGVQWEADGSTHKLTGQQHKRVLEVLDVVGTGDKESAADEPEPPNIKVMLQCVRPLTRRICADALPFCSSRAESKTPHHSILSLCACRNDKACVMLQVVTVCVVECTSRRMVQTGQHQLSRRPDCMQEPAWCSQQAPQHACFLAACCACSRYLMWPHAARPLLARHCLQARGCAPRPIPCGSAAGSAQPSEARGARGLLLGASKVRQVARSTCLGLITTRAHCSARC